MKKINYFLLVLSIMSTAIGADQALLNDKKALMELSSSYIIARAIHSAAQLKLADYLVDGPQSIAALALQTQLHEGALYRLLRLLASYNIFYEDENCNFSLTPLAKLLVSTDPNSLHPWIAYHHDNNRWTAYAEINHCIETGKPAFNYIFNDSFFNFISQSTEKSTQFDKGMKNISHDENSLVALSYSFSPYSRIVDVGGGTGGLIAEIINHNPTAQGILFDLPHVSQLAKNYINQQKLNQAITFVESTSFFNPIPSNANTYILKRILHDWDDQESITILRNCYNAMSNHSRLLIIEALVLQENTPDFSKNVDIEMMVLFGGKERTYKEWSTIIEAADLEIVTIYPTPSALSIIEIKKKEQKS